MRHDFEFRTGPAVKDSQVIGMFEKLLATPFASDMTYEKENNVLKISIFIEDTFSSARETLGNIETLYKIQTSVKEAPPVNEVTPPPKKALYLSEWLKYSYGDDLPEEQLTFEQYHEKCLEVFESSEYLGCTSIAFQMPEFTINDDWVTFDFFRTKRGGGTGVLKYAIDGSESLVKNINAGTVDFMHRVFAVMTIMLTNHEMHEVLMDDLDVPDMDEAAHLDAYRVANSKGSMDHRNFISLILDGFDKKYFETTNHFDSATSKTVVGFKNITDGGTEYGIRILYNTNQQSPYDKLPKSDALRFSVEFWIDDKNGDVCYPRLSFPAGMFMPMALATINPV